MKLGISTSDTLISGNFVFCVELIIFSRIATNDCGDNGFNGLFMTGGFGGFHEILGNINKGIPFTRI